MLAQNFKTAAELGLTEAQQVALIKTLALMDAGKLKHAQPANFSWEADRGLYYANGYVSGFNMRLVEAADDCGTVFCICGLAQALGGTGIDACATPALRELFMPDNHWDKFGSITVEQAAMALRSYLTTGDARWDLALSA